MPTEPTAPATTANRDADRLGRLDVLLGGCIELVRLTDRNTQTPPLCTCEMLGQVDDLADVVRVVRQLPVDRLKDRDRLAPDHDRPGKVRRGQRRQRPEERRPARLPSRQEA